MSAAPEIPARRGVSLMSAPAILVVVIAMAAFFMNSRRQHILEANVSEVKETPNPFADSSINGGSSASGDATPASIIANREIGECISAVAASKPADYNSLPTGTLIGENTGTGGLGELTVVNGTAEDAVAKLSGIDNHRLRSFFVKSQSSAHVAHIPKGTYKLAFTSGLDWNQVHHTFTWCPFYSKFEQAFNFDEHTISEGLRQYHRMSVTLHPVAFGNIRTKAITREEFLDGQSDFALQKP